MIKRSTNKTKQGYTILELLFYIAFFSVLSLVVINAMIAMSSSFKETAIHSRLAQGGNIMERISREIRSSVNINSISATDLVLDSKDEAGVSKTVEFLLNGSDIQLLENGVLIGNLNNPNLLVTNLSFTQIDTNKSKAVKISFSIRAVDDLSLRVEDFYDTVVLRGIY